MLAAIRQALSRVIIRVAARRPGSSSKYALKFKLTNCLNCHSIFYCHQNTRANRCRRATGRGVADDEAGGILLDRGPGRRESAGRYGWYGRAAFVGSVMVNLSRRQKAPEKSMVLVG
jgi:hypothetical protein